MDIPLDVEPRTIICPVCGKRHIPKKQGEQLLFNICSAECWAKTDEKAYEDSE